MVKWKKDEEIEVVPEEEAIVVTKTAKVQPEPEANVILGKNGKPLAQGRLNIGTNSMIIPDENQQRAGFYIEPRLVATLIAQFPDFEFKVLKKLGE